MTTSIVPASFQLPSGPEGRCLLSPIPASFERFYRETLRFRSGSRMRTLALAERYHAWALERDAPSLSLKELGRSMEAIGHRRLRSNGMLFLDVQLAVELPGVADNLPAGAIQ